MVWENDIRRLFLACSVCIPFLFTAAAFAGSGGVYVGLDQNGDLECSGHSDMYVIGMTVGDSVEFDVFWDNERSYDGLFSFACTFCVTDGRKVSLDHFTLGPDIPDGWTEPPVLNTPGDIPYIEVDPWIVDAYPYYKCWLASAADYTVSDPLPPGRYVFGTLGFRAAEDGSIGLLIDGNPNHTGWLLTNFTSGGCTAGLPQDPDCQCVPYTGSIDERVAWGSVKRLFR